MKANRAEIERAVTAPAEDIRLYLLYGPDRSGSEMLAARLARAMGEEAERIDLAGSELKGDPAKLADEAAAISLFGGRRHIRIDPAGEEILAAAQALLEAETAGNPVVAVAGALKGTSRLVKLALGSDRAIAFASYPLEGRDAEHAAREMAQQAGLQTTPEIARRLAESAGGDRAVLASEIAKYTLYLDAAPDRPRMLDHDAMDAVGAAQGEGDMSRLANFVLSGELADLDRELLRLASEGIEGVPLIRAVLRRLLLLARLRAEVERGDAVRTVMSRAGRAIFWKEKEAVASQLRHWTAPTLATAIARAGAAERALKSSGGPGLIAANDELFAIARQARRMR